MPVYFGSKYLVPYFAERKVCPFSSGTVLAMRKIAPTPLNQSSTILEASFQYVEGVDESCSISEV
jgi:hypothetical protein